MAGKQSVVSQQGSPVLFEVWKWHIKVWSWIFSDYELESSFWLVLYETFVEGPLVIHRDFGVVTNEVGNTF